MKGGEGSALMNQVRTSLMPAGDSMGGLDFEMGPLMGSAHCRREGEDGAKPSQALHTAYLGVWDGVFGTYTV